LGIELDLTIIKTYLERLEFACQALDEQTLKATVPDHRLDISDDPVIGRADLVEEVARMVGYDKIPETEMADVLPPQRNNTALDREEMLRDLLVNVGLQEIMSYRLTTIEAEARQLPAGVPKDDMPYVRVVNPISAERVVMRHTLVNSVLEVMTNNIRFTDGVQIFEIGQVFLADEGGILPQEQLRLAIAMTGPRETISWHSVDTGLRDFYDLKGVVESILIGLHIKDVAYHATQRPSYYPGRAASLNIGGEFAGVLGEIHPQVAAAYELPEDVPVLVADLDLNTILSSVDDRYRVTPISRFPAVQQDIALILDEAVPAAQVDSLIRQSGGFLLADAELFDVYRGDPLPAGKKSLAYRLTFQAPDKTLNDKVVATQQERIVKRLEKELGAKLRS
jgi:phenylalanyl-tRNA synthetase beta chain